MTDGERDRVADQDQAPAANQGQAANRDQATTAQDQDRTTPPEQRTTPDAFVPEPSPGQDPAGAQAAPGFRAAPAGYSSDPDSSAESPERDPYARKLSSPLYRFFDQLYFLVKLHGAILLFTLLGAGVLGLFPALYAAQAILEDQSNGIESPVYPRFKRLWRENFRRLNQLALVVYLCLGLLFGAWYGLWHLRQPALASLLYLLFFLASIGTLFLIFYGPLTCLYFPQATLSFVLRYSLTFGWTRFGTSLLLILVATGVTLFILFLPQLAMWIALSLLPWASQRLMRRALPRELLERHARRADGL